MTGAPATRPTPRASGTDYLWQETLTPESLTDIIENYAQQDWEEADLAQVPPDWSRCASFSATSRPRAPESDTSFSTPRAAASPTPSPGWPASSSGSRQDAQTIFDSTIIVTDRRVLDSQINETVRQFTQVGSTVGHAESGADLKRLITEGKRIIITTVQKFPVIAKAMAEEHLDRKFAIIIDEAHSSQGGRTTADMHAVLGDQPEEDEDIFEDEDTFEDQINRIIEGRKMLGNAQLLRLHRHAQEQDPGALRGPLVPARWDREAPAFPQLHHEAGYPGGVHPGRP